MGSLQSSAQKNLDLNNYQLDFDMVPIQGDSLQSITSKPGKQRCVWKTKVSGVREIKVVTKPFKKMTKVQVLETKSDMKYQVTYFVIDGQISSYLLVALANFQKRDAPMFNINGKRLDITFIRGESGYFGEACVYGLIDSSCVTLFYPASKKLFTPGQSVSILLPVFSEKQQTN